jgi:uronate dehydrogenase
MTTVVMTGAAGGVARQIRPLVRGLWHRLVLSDRRAPADLRESETFWAAELTDLGAMERLFADVDGVVHLGGYAVEGPWDAIHEANIVGLYNTYEAARRQGVKRIVFASSNHAVGFYRRDERIDHDVQPRPDSRYGVSKVFGEALGSLYARKHGLRTFNIRIGNVAARPADHRRLSMWLHPEDLVQLIRIGLAHPAIVDDVVYGASHCERAWWDNRHARALGYRPRHRAEDHAAYALEQQAKLDPDPIGDQFQGGGFCSEAFDHGLADRD